MKLIETRESYKELLERINMLIEVGLIDSKKSRVNDSSFELKIEKEGEEYILAGEFGEITVDKDRLVYLVEEMENQWEVLIEVSR